MVMMDACVLSKCLNIRTRASAPAGARVHGNDDPPDDHAPTDAADPVPPTAASPAPAAAGSHAPAGKMTSHLRDL